ncbi:hypothetical protein M422DRAFT_264103 [Sphaerobolus stellatus SS14]|uniref:Uncharacterized protein n=1 Tax=Sphaerobolus stellatus (strain SS14) TaxID=990650 RepID=A0A0C9TTW6_SPHS4|nr:hypothetical protein M422DRAFT_264103 [Sphaerobolus stellatus SS14]
MASPHALYTLALNIRAKLALLFHRFRRSVLPLSSLLFPWINFSSANLDRNPTNPTLRFPQIAHMTSLIHSLPAASRPLIAIDPTFLSPFHISSLAAPISADLAVNSITKTHQRPLRYPQKRRHPPQRLHPEAKGNKDTIDALYTRLQFLQNAHVP